jgi:hypothetical protein
VPLVAPEVPDDVLPDVLDDSFSFSSSAERRRC